MTFEFVGAVGLFTRFFSVSLMEVAVVAIATDLPVDVVAFSDARCRKMECGPDIVTFV